MNVQPLMTYQIVGLWLGVFLTFCILSFLYKDNPFYKLAEHLFVGTSIGIVVLQQYYQVLKPNLINRIWDEHKWWYLIALVLTILLFVRMASRKLSWVGRYPVAFIVGLYAGINIPAFADSNLLMQTKAATADLVKEKIDLNNASVGQMRKLPGFGTAVALKVVASQERNASGIAQNPMRSVDDVMKLPGLSPRQLSILDNALPGPRGIKAQAFVGTPGKPTRSYDLFGIFSLALMLVGTISALVYFYFSVPHKGVVGKVARFGVWILMIGFGASFGYTVQGRISLAIGRAFSILDYDKVPAHGAQVHGAWVAGISILIIVLGIFLFETRWKKKDGGDGEGGESSGGGGGTGTGTGTSEELPEY